MDEEIEIILQPDEVEVTEPLVADYVLPKATSDTLGGVKIGDNISIDSAGHISVPIASESSAGVIKVGTGLSIASDGTLSSTGGYELPQATKTTLGGVYVDDELDNLSVNPVQNGVVATGLSNLSTTVSTVSGDVTNLSTTVGNLSTTVGNLSTTVGNHSTAITNNANDIDNCESDITSLEGRMDDAENGLTNLGNSLDETNSDVSGLMNDINETYTYQDIDDTIWTAGDVKIRGKGFYAVLYIQLEGTLTIPASSSATLYTLPNDYIPRFDAYGGADIVDGSISVKVDSSTGNIILINNNTSSMNVGKINASVPIIYGSV